MDPLPPAQSLVSSVSLRPSSLPLLLPVSPRVPIGVRVATLADVPFMDAMQKRTTKQVGWMPTKQLEGKVLAGQVLVAEATTNKEEGGRVKDEGNSGDALSSLLSSFNPQTSSLLPVGYLIGQDRYFKRDDVGIIYQINVLPEYRRSLVAGLLLKAQFERSAYGCKLYCCWCAQDIEANRFWEAMGFVPLAFRTGSAKKSRVHIFWQRRIWRGDTTTAWWFPSQTAGGAIREDRLVLPIPPGVRWSDEMPRVLPDATADEDERACPELAEGTKDEGKAKRLPSSSVSPPPSSVPTQRPAGLWFGTPAAARRRVKPKAKNDPRLVAAARELRDRWLEQVGNGGSGLIAGGKYDATRQIATMSPTVAALPIAQALLPAA